jgi:hypothetical protein
MEVLPVAPVKVAPVGSVELTTVNVMVLEPSASVALTRNVSGDPWPTDKYEGAVRMGPGVTARVKDALWFREPAMAVMIMVYVVVATVLLVEIVRTTIGDCPSVSATVC